MFCLCSFNVLSEPLLKQFQGPPHLQTLALHCPLLDKISSSVLNPKIYEICNETLVGRQCLNVIPCQL